MRLRPAGTAALGQAARRLFGRLVGYVRREWAAARPRSGWRFVVPVIGLAAGVLFATSAETAHGTDLRSSRRQLEQLVAERNDQSRALSARIRALNAQIDAQTADRALHDHAVAGIADQSKRLKPYAGLSALTGPGLTVTLDDAPRRSDGSLPPRATPDDVVVHQQDVQAVVNGLWAGGAEAMTIMGQRVIQTSAVRCVGNTLLLEGRTYSPPFVVVAIGELDRMRQRLDAEPGVQIFRQYVDAFGLRLTVRASPQLSMPGYDGPITLQFAKVPGR